MPLDRAPPGGVTIGGYFYRGGSFIPPVTPVGLGHPAQQRAPPGGITIGGYFYRGGSFIPVEAPGQPVPPPVLDPDTRIVDSLVQLGPPESGNIRTVRVHVDEGMSAADVISEIEAIVENWNARYQQGAATRLVDFWRQE